MRKVLLILIAFLGCFLSTFSQNFIGLTDMNLYNGLVSVNAKVSIEMSYEHLPVPNTITPTVISNTLKTIYFNDGNSCRLATNGGFDNCFLPACRANLNSPFFCLLGDAALADQRYKVRIHSFNIQTMINGNIPGEIITPDNPVEFIVEKSTNGKLVCLPKRIINLPQSYKLHFNDVGFGDPGRNLSYDLYINSSFMRSVEKSHYPDRSKICDVISSAVTLPDRDLFAYRYYEKCKLDENQYTTLDVSTNDLNYHRIMNQVIIPPVINPKHHDFKIKLVGQSSSLSVPDFEPIGVFTSGGTYYTKYRHPFDHIDPSPVASPGNAEEDYMENNYSTNVFESYTDYEITICEFMACGGGPDNNCCKVPGLVDFEDKRQVKTRRFIYRTYKPLTWVYTDKINPCKNNNRQRYWGEDALQNPEIAGLGSYTQYGQISGNINRRIGGYDSSIYTVTLCKDNNPNEGYQGADCDICFTPKNIVVTPTQQDLKFNFSYLPKGDYWLEIKDGKGCGVFEKEFILKSIDLNDPNALVLDVSPSPAFICPVEFGSGQTSSVSLTATPDFDMYKWKYICSNSNSVISNNQILTVNKGKGGLYQLTASKSGLCEQTVEVEVIDLNLPEIKYPSISNVLQNNALKFEHVTTPVLSSMPWSTPQSIMDFDRMNSYISGKSGIYRGKQTFDYLDARQRYTLSNHNANIKSSGVYNDVSIFNWQHPGLLFCEPEWKLNNTVSKFSLGSHPLENRDIMGLYSSSLYGYNGKLPVAVSQLGKYEEIAFESFEEYDVNQEIDQLSNSSGNFDLVNIVKTGEVLYYEEHEVLIGMSGYGLIRMEDPQLCPGQFFVADVISRSINNDKITCDGSKSIEGEVPDVKIKVITPPCPNIDGVLVEFEGGIVPPFIQSSGSNCLPWNGFIRSKNYKSYTQAKDYTLYANVTDERAHTGSRSLKLEPRNYGGFEFENKDIRLEPNKEYLLSFWVSTYGNETKNEETLNLFNRNNKVSVDIKTDSYVSGSSTFFPKGAPVEGWQKIDAVFKTGSLGGYLTLEFNPLVTVFIDDIRFSPLNANMQTHVYDVSTYRLISTLDQNNFATIYKYDDQGNLFLIQKETQEGFKTVQMNQSYISNN